MRFPYFHAAIVLVGFDLVACSSSDDNGSGAGAGTGGTAAAGGATGAGGAATSGGATGAGGSSAGGAVAAGGATAAGGAGSYVPPQPALPAPVGYVAGGNFAPLGTYTGITGRGQIVRSADGKTTVSLHVEGLTASTKYAAHVHALPCSVDNGGGHYQIDPAATAGETNEIWPGFTTDADGVGNASVTANHYARPDAQSIVIHDPAASAKMACVDLLPEPLATTTAKGTFAPFAKATPDEKNVAGTATLERSATGTTVTLAVTGLSSTATYMAHVHALPCALMDAGGHYKLDPTNADTVETNELWPKFGTTPGAATVTSTAVARPDAQSVVIHRMDMNSSPAPKVACADLVRVEPYAPLKTEGTVKALPDAATHGAGSVKGTATMTRDVAPKTEVTVTIEGLKASTAYGVHVHDHSCALKSGGGHYKFDPAVTTADQANEIWLNFTSDASGKGTGTASPAHLARPEAGSIVIHDPDASRVACIDLL